MLEYINCFLLLTILSTFGFIYVKTKKYLPILKMADTAIDNLIGYDLGNPDKKEKLLQCVLTGDSKLYLGKIYTEEQINKLSPEEIEKLFNIYEAKLSGQMVKSLGKSIIYMYSTGACSVLGINNQVALSQDLENDPFLNSALQRFTCDLYYRFGSFLAPLSVGLITGRHYIAEKKLSDVINNDRTGSGITNPSDNEGP